VQSERKPFVLYKTVDHLYSTQRDAYKALPHPPFGKSDHNSILLLPAYNQKLNQEVPVTHSIRKWSDDVDAKQRTVLLAQTGICSGILPMALKSTPHQSQASSISTLIMSSPE
jgi:cell division septation protein DedD